MSPGRSLLLLYQWGSEQFKQTPFGLSQAPAYFELLIDKVLMGCSKFAMGYLDDIIIFSNNEIEHLRHIEEIFTRLERFGLKMKREKCDFLQETYPVPGPSNSRRWIHTSPRETREHPRHAKTKDTLRSETILRL